MAHGGSVGEAEEALLRAVRELDSAEFRPLALLGEAGPLVAELRRVGVETFVLPLPAAARGLGREEMTPGGLLRNVGAVRALLGYAADVARWARRQGVDVIHAATLKANLYGGLAGRVAGVPVVWSVLDPLGPADLPRAGGVLFRALARHVPSAVFCGSDAAAAALGIPPGRPGRVRVAYPGLSREEVVSGTCLAALRYSPASVLSVPFGLPLQVGLFASGTPAEREESLGRFREAQEEVARDRQRRSTSSLPPAQMEFRSLGRCDMAATGADALRDLHIVVVSGEGGAGATAALQAMATGLPVIAVGGGACEVIADGENGLAVARADAPGLAAAIRRLLDNPGLRSSLGRQAHAHVSRHHRASDAARALEEAYRGACAGWPRRRRPAPAAIA